MNETTTAPPVWETMGLPLTYRERRKVFGIYISARMYKGADGRVKSLRAIARDHYIAPGTAKVWLKKYPKVAVLVARGCK